MRLSPSVPEKAKATQRIPGTAERMDSRTDASAKLKTTRTTTPKNSIELSESFVLSSISKSFRNIAQIFFIASSFVATLCGSAPFDVRPLLFTMNCTSPGTPQDVNDALGTSRAATPFSITTSRSAISYPTAHHELP